MKIFQKPEPLTDEEIEQKAKAKVSYGYELTVIDRNFRDGEMDAGLKRQKKLNSNYLEAYQQIKLSDEKLHQVWGWFELKDKEDAFQWKVILFLGIVMMIIILIK